VLHGSMEDEGWRLRKDGTRFWADVVITVLRDDEGELAGFAKVTRDLTEQREAGERLRTSEERFRLLVQSVRDYAIFMLDPGGHVATWNEGAQHIKGYTAEDVIGRHFSTFYPEDVQAVGFPQHELQVAAETGRFEDEGWRVRKDGSFFWASVVITALRNDDGELVGFAKVTRDLTERRQAQEKALDDARRVAEVEAANRAKSEFLATLSHELRTPLNAIGGYADLLCMAIAGPLNSTQRHYVDRVRSSQQHLLGLVNDLLSLSRMEAGVVEVDTGPIDMGPLLRELRGMIEPELLARGVGLDVSGCPPDTLATGDARRVRQVLLNLLSNAVKFTPPAGRVELACSCTGDAVSVSVRDSGPGIPQDKLEAIFEPFVQLGRSLTEPKDGIGLGLAISRRLARAMNGDLEVESRPGAGATFTLTLPRASGRGRPPDRTS
jgi:PAS domain S-box-containing protein